MFYDGEKCVCGLLLATCILYFAPFLFRVRLGFIQQKLETHKDAWGKLHWVLLANGRLRLAIVMQAKDFFQLTFEGILGVKYLKLCSLISKCSWNVDTSEGYIIIKKTLDGEIFDYLLSRHNEQKTSPLSYISKEKKFWNNCCSKC